MKAASDPVPELTGANFQGDSEICPQRFRQVRRSAYIPTRKKAAFMRLFLHFHLDLRKKPLYNSPIFVNNNEL